MFQFSSSPLGIGQQLDQSFKLTRGVYKDCLGVIALTIAIGILSSFANVSIDPENPEAIDLVSIAGLFIFALLTIYLYFLLTVRICYSAFARGDMTDSLITSLKGLLSLIVFYVCMVLVVGIGFVLLIIPGFILLITLSLGLYAMVLEETGPVDALKRSHSLVWGHWWRTATVLTVGGLIVSVFYLLLGVVVGALSVSTEEETMTLLTNLANGVLGPFIQPYFVCLGLVIFHDLRTRREGADLETQIANL